MDDWLEDIKARYPRVYYEEDGTVSRFQNGDDIHRLVAEVERLRGLILRVERSRAWKDCPFCEQYVGHAPDCPAFSAPGVVR